MPRNERPLEKNKSLGHIVKVQQVIDFIVLSDLMKGQRYHSEMEQFITHTLSGSTQDSLSSRVGVNDAYFSQRLQALTEKGHVSRHWEGDNRYNRYYEITESGRDYFKKLLRELPEQVKLAQQVYDVFSQYVAAFHKINLN